MWNSGNYSQLKDCLMSVDISIGIQHTDDNVPLNTPYGNAICWNIVQDNYFFPDVPRNLAKKRSNKPVIIGNSKDEWAIWESIRMSKNETQYTNYTKAYAEYYLSSRFANFFGNQTQDIIGILENTYLEPGTSNDDNLAWLKFLVDIGTSFFFTGFAAKEAEFHLWNNNSNVYLYEFTYWADFYPFTAKPYPIGNWHPDPHVSEGRFLFFDNMQSINATAADLAIADFIGESWTNFAKYGTPNNSWTPTTSTGLINMEYYDIGCTSGMKSGFRALDRVTFDRTLPLLVGILPPETPDNNNGSIIPTSSPASTPTSSPTSTPTSPPASTRILTSTHKNGASIKGFGIGECIAMLLPLHIVCHFYRIL
uniref:Carboxylesterase type B domain-containing protein n=1 Tax=Acrobeloides nanus TaxID=290746 RepID=A0A914DMI8_9BILA